MAAEPEPADPSVGGKPPETLQEYFVLELRRLRRGSGLSQTQLAERIKYSAGLVSMVETLQRHPTPDFTKRCDDALSTGGTLSRLLPMLAREAYPTWFRSYVALEAEAVSIEEFEIQVVPGLFQTEEYARAVFSPAWPPMTSDEMDRRLKARLERQQILSRDQPPLVWMILDESVLRRLVGSAEIMADQLAYLLELAGRSNIKLQVLTYDRAFRAPLDGSVVLLELQNHERLVYVEGLGRGHVMPAPEDVEKCSRAIDAMRCEALSVTDSVAMITQLREEFYAHA